ncbi:tetraspanin-2 isoform X3 [Falco biarmicus]|uniref:Tetraspanin n=1 Tax=Falco tinnunculus TaxID=100819 RepID=A0A8C4XNA4_FALTI|nr:tetraspanin-2 isoform X3 [Falco rusticolus]XP_040472378.1 tetraspanin-2 isoform X3 [Falco naumanni]XP_055583872.1 tetraspanin-2 isoform X3 [Falco cherrug]XP_055675616.1 tetraspanin-2 isoform X3 [Falco peregrinus]XP_056217342.1 tetraspanin-2 isoform X3 [Falco biarmicus]
MGTGRGGMRCIKILLCIFNLTFWLAGLAVIAFGLWLRFGGVMADFASEKKSPEYFFMGLYVLVGAGALMTTVGFFGCCGAARESQCLLGAFFACLLVIFAAEVTAGVFAFIGKKVAIQEAQKIYEDIYDDYMKNPGGEVNRTIFRYHLALQCCGKDNMEQQMGLPCPENIQMPKNCLIEIQNVIDANLHLIGIVGIAIAGITIFGMIFSMVLCCVIRNTRDMI